MPTANNTGITRTWKEILHHWDATKFTGIALVNVNNGVPWSIEFGRPDRIQLDHAELLEKLGLTTESQDK